MRPPKDPVLLTTHRIGLLSDLTPSERFALFVVWRFCGHKWTEFGPPLLAHLIGVKSNTARQILYRLKSHGYINSQGGGGRGRIAMRKVADKANLPRLKPATPDSALAPLNKSKLSMDGALKCQQALALTVSQTTPHRLKAERRNSNGDHYWFENPRAWRDGDDKAATEFAASVRRQKGASP